MKKKRELFAKLEENVKKMIENKSDGGNMTGVNPAKLKKMMETSGAGGMMSSESA